MLHDTVKTALRVRADEAYGKYKIMDQESLAREGYVSKTLSEMFVPISQKTTVLIQAAKQYFSHQVTQKRSQVKQKII